MSLKVKESGSHIVVYLSGRMDVHLASEIENELNDIIQKNNQKNIVLNLDDVEYMSSSGLRVFVSLMRTLKESGRNLKLCNLSLAVRKVFEVVELMDMFDIYESEEEALAGE
ncbi:MAG: STAS domain-containing protein [Leptospiraceae bacterium]|nr:STAS domain-containing protein [Leptospiraceae bacterium]MCB1169214.1 STAS domain-containing protein [Leptospiraceae bacterium]